jgi:hypothetical protein
VHSVLFRELGSDGQGQYPLNACKICVTHLDTPTHNTKHVSESYELIQKDASLLLQNFSAPGHDKVSSHI